MRRALAATLTTLAAAAGTPAPALARPADDPPTPARATVTVIETRFGRMLADGRGHALYLFTRDRAERSRCHGACARAWPPLLTRDAPRARDGARGRHLGTTRRRRGGLQVTYRGHPLYFYVDETEPRQVLCQDVDEFGGTWLVVAPSGRAIR